MHTTTKSMAAVALLLGVALSFPTASADHECDKTIEFNCIEENPWHDAICLFWLNTNEPLLPFKDGCYGIDSNQRCHTDLWFNCKYEDDYGDGQYCTLYARIGVALFCMTV